MLGDDDGGCVIRHLVFFNCFEVSPRQQTHAHHHLPPPPPLPQKEMMLVEGEKKRRSHKEKFSKKKKKRKKKKIKEIPKTLDLSHHSLPIHFIHLLLIQSPKLTQKYVLFFFFFFVFFFCFLFFVFCCSLILPWP